MVVQALPVAAGLPTERLIKKRLRSEMEIVRSLVKKAETLVARDSRRVQGGAAAAAAVANSKSRPLPRGGKSERLSHRSETRPEAKMMASAAAGSKRRRTTVTGLLADEGAKITVAVDKVHLSPVISKEEDEEIDICGGVSPVAVEMVHLSPLGKARKQEEDELVHLSPLGKQEETELIDICGGLSPVAVEMVPLSPLGKQEEAELINICGDVPQPCTSSSSSSGSSCSESSSSSSSGSSGSSSSSSSGSSGSSSSSSDSDSDDEDSATSTPTSAHLPNPTEATDQDEQDHAMLTEKEASPDTQMRELIARALEKKKLQHELDRKRAREQLEEMERTTRPIFGSLDRNDMRLLGITAIEHIVSPVKSRESVRRRGGLLQQLGFFLKAEC